MIPDTILTLGDFDFTRYEVPERINFGGDQRLIVHKLVGGQRKIDAMGFDPAPVEWSGLLFGDTALERGHYLNTLAQSGQQVPLTWSELFYLVVVRTFHADFERGYQIPYHIVCEVVDDLTIPTTYIAAPNVDDAMTEDMFSIGVLVGLINDSALSGAFATLQVSVGAVSSFANAAQSVIGQVLQPLRAVSVRVQGLIGGSNLSLSGGLSLGIPGAMNAASLLAQSSSATQLPQLLQLNGLVGRVAANLGIVNQSGRSLVVAGGDLMKIATQQYGDPMGWTAIAGANNLTDPALTGIQTLKIPPFNNKTGGVFSG